MPIIIKQKQTFVYPASLAAKICAHDPGLANLAPTLDFELVATGLKSQDREFSQLAGDCHEVLISSFQGL